MLKKVIKKPILGLKEGTLGIADLLLQNEMEVNDSSLISKKMVPSPENPELLVPKYELDFVIISQRINFELMKQKNLMQSKVQEMIDEVNEAS